VRAPHEIPDRAPIRVAPGDWVSVGERDTTWLAFVFVSTGEGDGWVPARHLDGNEVITPYDTTELPTIAGERLDVLRRDDESGWLWCRNQGGREGWVPISTVIEDDGP
jgi:hypothetical protein